MEKKKPEPKKTFTVNQEVVLNGQKAIVMAVWPFLDDKKVKRQIVKIEV